MPRKKKEEVVTTEAPAAEEVKAEIVAEKAAETPAEAPKEDKIEKEQFSRERMEAVQHFVFKQVATVVFGVLSPKMIKKMASAKIVTPELYDKEGYPVDGGLMDIRLGVIDPGLRCKTCGCKLKECIGHFGYIELARPVVHIKFVPVILSLLRSTCHECGKILIPKEKLEKSKRI